MPMRVLAVAQSGELGGAELALLRVAPFLPGLGVSLELAVPHDGPLAAAAAGSAIPVHRVPVGPLRAGGWPAAVAVWPRARRLVRRVGPDVVWLNGIVPQRLVPALGRVPVMLHLHDMLDRPPRPWRSARFWRRVPVVACPSRAVVASAEAAGAPGARLRVVPEPVETGTAAPRPGWADGRPVVGFVGRIEPRKGVLDLLVAMRALQARRPEVRLVMVRAPDIDPDADYQRRVRDEASLLGDSVVTVGPVGDATTLMPWFDVLCVPSHAEPFGTVAAEALAAGTPAVVTDSGGMPEYVAAGVCGEVVPVGAPSQLAEALQRTLGRAGSMAAAARAAAAPFAPDRVAREVAALLREAAGR